MQAQTRTHNIHSSRSNHINTLCAFDRQARAKSEMAEKQIYLDINAVEIRLYDRSVSGKHTAHTVEHTFRLDKD